MAPMVAKEMRNRLAAMQAELMRALAGQGLPPAGADARRLRAAADSLRRKRQRSVARAWPGLARTLGARFGELFTVYAAKSSIPMEGGPLADGRSFAHFLAERGALPEVGRLEAFAVDLRYAACPGGLVPRRRPAFKMALFKRPRRLVLALRLPWFGEKWLSLPLGRP
jgi:hypothetical protein